VNDPVLGPLTHDEKFGGYTTAEKTVAFLHGRRCRFVLENYADDPRPDEIRRAVQNALDATPAVLGAAEPYVVRYCKEMLDRYEESERPAVNLTMPSDVWSHVRFGSVFYASRRAEGDGEDGIYLSLECNCDWEVEHGLQLVLRDGRTVSKVGPFDGHLTNADAFADRSLVGVLYRPMGPRRRQR